MLVTMKIGDRIKIRRLEISLTQTTLSEACGWSGSGGVRISNYEKNIREPNYSDILTLARVLKVKPGWLLFGDEDEVKENHVGGISSKGNMQSRKIPLLTSDQVEDWIKSPILKDYHKTIDMIIFNKKLGKNVFSFEVTSKSMFDSSDHSSLVPGEIAIIDPDIINEVKPGDLVFVKFDEGDIRIRQYQQDGKHIILKAFDKDIPSVPLSEGIQIMGIIVMTCRIKHK